MKIIFFIIAEALLAYYDTRMNKIIKTYLGNGDILLICIIQNKIKPLSIRDEMGHG